MNRNQRAEKGFLYTLSVLLGKQCEELVSTGRIAYAHPPQIDPADPPRLYILPSGFFGDDYGTPASLPALPLKDIEGVPLLFGTPEIQRMGKSLLIKADIIASAFFLLTRYEEMTRPDERDRHGRFPGRQSLPYRAGFIERPVVDEYGDLLRNWLAEIGIKASNPRKKFSALLTHDIDSFQKYSDPLRTLAESFLGRRPRSNITEYFSILAGRRKDPHDNIDDLIGLDAPLSSQAAPPVYFFIADERKPYDVRSQRSREIIQTVLRSGAEIGLHPSYAAGEDPQRLAAEKERLEEVSGAPIRKSRHHYLRWREIEDARHLRSAGIDWDSSMGYADAPGFRLGVCRPIALFDPRRFELFGIEEHPLILMDCTLDAEIYLHLDESEASELTFKLLETTRRHRGEFVTLWHNSNLEPSKDNYHPALYRSLIAKLGDALSEQS